MNDRKWVHISNIDPLAIIQPRELSHAQNSTFQADWSITAAENLSQAIEILFFLPKSDLLDELNFVSNSAINKVSLAYALSTPNKKASFDELLRFFPISKPSLQTHLILSGHGSNAFTAGLSESHLVQLLDHIKKTCIIKSLYTFSCASGGPVSENYVQAAEDPSENRYLVLTNSIDSFSTSTRGLMERLTECWTDKLHFDLTEYFKNIHQLIACGNFTLHNLKKIITDAYVATPCKEHYNLQKILPPYKGNIPQVFTALRETNKTVSLTNVKAKQMQFLPKGLFLQQKPYELPQQDRKMTNN